MKRMLIDAGHPEEMRVAIAENKHILEFDFISAARPQVKGNVYLAKVTRVEPSLQAAFVEYGCGRQGFLPFSEIHPDYYQIPVSDRQKLMEEVERELEEDAAEEDAAIEAASNPSTRKRRPRTRRRRGSRDKDSDGADKQDDKASDKRADAADAGDVQSTKSDEQGSAEKVEAKSENKADSTSDSKKDSKKDGGDTPGTQYAKSDEPSVSSDEVKKGDEPEAAVEEKPKRRRPSLRRRLKKDVPAETVEESKDAPASEEPKDAPKAEAKDVAKAEAPDEAAPAQVAAANGKLAVTPPAEVNLGAALFSEEEPFDVPGEEPKAAPKSAKKDANNDAGDDHDDGDDEGVETIDSEEESTKPKRNKKRVPIFKRYNIQEVVKRGQVVLVQVVKEERGNKGASVTTYLSLAGRYCVLMPNSPRDGGVSRKISDIETRKRLKDVMSQLVLAKGMSVIIRTAGIDRNRSEIRRDFDYLVKLWNQIRDNTLSANAPALVYEESNLIKRAIRDLYTSDIDQVLVEGEAAYEESREFMKMLMPSHTARVKHYKSDMPLFYEHGIEEQLASMHDPVVKLKSGGYLVINPTEALISIDVNSGKSTGERNIEETAVKNNIEAAHEVARQLRLRDLAGLVVIDFIDMMDSRNRRSVERNLKDALRSDRAKIQVGRISPFGLMEMSRQRLRPSIGEAMHTSCPTCAGGGLVRAPESLALHITRTMEKEAVSGRWSELKLRVARPTALFLLNQKRSQIAEIEQQYDISITVDIDDTVSVSEFAMDRTRGTNSGRGRKSADKKPNQSDESNDRDDNSDVKDSEPRGRSRRGGRGGRRNNKIKDDVAEDNAEAPKAAESKAEKPKAASPRADKKSSGDDQEERLPRKLSGAKKASADKPEAAKAKPAAKSEANDSDVEVTTELPEFTKQEAVKPKVEEKPADSIAEPQPDTSRPKGAPPRKGWWQQMIELD